MEYFGFGNVGIVKCWDMLHIQNWSVNIWLLFCWKQNIIISVLNSRHLSFTGCGPSPLASSSPSFLSCLSPPPNSPVTSYSVCLCRFQWCNHNHDFWLPNIWHLTMVSWSVRYSSSWFIFIQQDLFSSVDPKIFLRICNMKI